ncbi:MAG: hypothetical protein H7836_11435 [Magnetococcus sp. YQC-3]
MTLTSAVGMSFDIRECFNLLNKRLYWVLPIHFVCSGDLSYEVACSVYGEENLDVLWSFDYMKVLTSEGVCGVVHILYFGIYIPKSWLSDNWFDITGCAYVVDVRETYQRDDNFSGIARYCIEQYTAGQELFLGYYCSHGWIFKGAWRCYSTLRDECKDYSRIVGDMFGNPVYFVNKRRLREVWEACVDRGGLLPSPAQMRLDGSFESFMAQVHEVSGSVYGFRF